MIRKLTLLVMTIMLTVSGFNQTKNPLLQEWTTPFKVPPFSEIKNEHYLPAFTEAMKRHTGEIEAITGNTAPPTFENTIVALDKSGSLLDKVSSVFYGLNSANTNKEMQDIAKQLSPLVTRHSDDITLNSGLFKRVSIVYENREKLNLDQEQLRLLTETYKGFIRGGASLDQKSQEKLRELNKEINMLQITFGQNLLAETNGYKMLIESKKDLSGLPENVIMAAEIAAKATTTGTTSTSSKKSASGAKEPEPISNASNGNAAASAETAVMVEEKDKGTKDEKWVFGLQNPSVMPFLQFADNRELREAIFSAYISRCNNDNEFDNKKYIVSLVALRLEKARLLGYENYASLVLEDRMAKNPENVFNLLEKIWNPAIAKAKDEAKELETMMNTELGGVELQAWDWRYYSEKQMKQQFQLDDASLKPYFMLENVRDGVFMVAEKLYGITFTEVKNAPTYYDGVKLYECKDADGSHLGVLYFDFHPRASKRGGAWCGSYRAQSNINGKRVAPVMTIVCNFTAPTAGMPALLTADETETLFHEFGHALHGLLKNVRYKGLATVPRDFVELPSQIMEHWAFEPEVLKLYAKHYKTGEVIPGTLVEKIVASGKFGQGFKTTEYLAASFLDMYYHVLTSASDIDVITFEKENMGKIGLIPQIPPRYRSTYFQHSMTGGYTAGYYSYIWAEVLDADAFDAFTETGDIFNKDVAARFRKNILERGGSRDAMEMYMDFRGREPGIEPLLKCRGLN